MAAATKNYYQTLGVAETSSADEIKKAYRKLAKKYHPDATGGDKAKEARFKEASEAYDTLGDEKKRAAYDEARRNPFAGTGGYPGAGYPGGGYAGGGGFNVDLGDLFSRVGRGGSRSAGGGSSFSDLFNMFGGGGAEGRRAPQRGEDVVAKLEVDLPEAALGGEKEVQVDGKRLTIKIPAGVTAGKTIRLAGQGQPGGHGAPAGDLLIELTERPHSRFRRLAANSADIEVDLPVPVDVAILGGKAETPTLEGGSVTLTIPPGSSSGRRLRLRGKGAVAPPGRGDLYAVILVHVPSEIPERARELISEFARLTKK
jgi:DnaJ-class molecular chaperone